MTSEENPLIRGILDDARKKADEIISSADAEASSIVKEAELRAEKEKSFLRNGIFPPLSKVSARWLWAMSTEMFQRQGRGSKTTL